MTIIHSAMTDTDGIHEPKGFDAASNSTYLTKNASGVLEWQTDNLLEIESVGCSGYLPTATDTIFTGAGWQDVQGTFTFVTCQGFTEVGAVYDGIIYNHTDSHYMAINLSATVSSSVVNTIVSMGYGVNSNTVAQPGTINSCKCVSTGEPYVIGLNFTVYVTPSNELTLMMYANKAATITLETCQVNSFKLYQEN